MTNVLLLWILPLKCRDSSWYERVSDPIPSLPPVILSDLRRRTTPPDHACIYRSATAASLAIIDASVVIPERRELRLTGEREAEFIPCSTGDQPDPAEARDWPWRKLGQKLCERLEGIDL